MLLPRPSVFARRTSDRFEQLEILEWLGIALLMSPMPATEGEVICRRLLADAAIDPRLEITIIGALAYMVGIQGRAEEAAAPDREGSEHAAATTRRGSFRSSRVLSAWLSTDCGHAEREFAPSTRA